MTNPDTSIIPKLFESNREWASDVAKSKPDFFTVSAKGQQPKVLWIGWCVHFCTAALKIDWSNSRL
jgi:hypothetical protein